MRKDEIVIDVITSQQSIALNLLKEQKKLSNLLCK